MQFELHPKLASKLFIKDLPLCRVLLSDEKHYPWLILIPRRPNVSRLIDLNETDQLILMRELDFVQKVLWNEFKPDQLNVATIGNKVSQLHVHLIARFGNDPAWPGTVWDHPVRGKYDPETRDRMIARLSQLLETG